MPTKDLNSFLLDDLAFTFFPHVKGYQDYKVISASSIVTSGENNSVLISTDKEAYTVGEYAVISGAVPHNVPGKNLVRLDVYDSQGVVVPNLNVYNNQVEIVSSLHLINLINNNFTYIIGTKNIEPGIFKIIATYGQQTGQTELKVVLPQSIISESSNPQATESIAAQEKNSGQNNTSETINLQPVSSENAESKLIKYENSKYSFSLLHPSNWTKSETNLQPKEEVTFYLTNPIPTGGKSFPPTLLISVEPAPDNTDIELYPEEYINSIFTDPSQFKIIKHTEGVLSGSKAKGVVLNDYTNKRTLMELRVFSIIGNNIYRIGYFSEPQEFATHFEEISQVLKSFSVTMPSTTSSNLGTTPTPITDLSDSNRQNTSSISSETSNQSYYNFKEGDLTVTYIGKLGSFGHEASQFDHPAGVAVDPSSNSVYVADINNNRVQKFTLDGQFVLEWGSLGVNEGEFNHPADVAVDSTSNSVFVTDIENNRIQIFNPQGKFISSFGSGGTGDGQFDHPGNVAIDSPSGFLYVADIGNNRIQKFSLDGSFIASWGSIGTSEGQFNRPAGLALNKESKLIYVTDTKNNRIQVFNYDGQFVSEWGSLGNSKGEFNRPTDITVDERNGLIFVTDNENQRVQLFTVEGTFITEWGSKGEGDDQFLEPTGISFNSDQNVIYVSDKPGNKISVYRLSSNNG